MTCNMKQHEGRKGGCERHHGLSEAPEVRRAKYLDSKERAVAIRPTYKSKKQLKRTMQTNSYSLKRVKIKRRTMAMHPILQGGMGTHPLKQTALEQAMQKAKSHVTRTKFRACWV